MSKQIVASVANVSNDGYCTVVAFADENATPPDYVILQVVNNPSAKDVQLAQDGVHLEVGDQTKSGYNLIRSISVNGNSVELLLCKDIAEQQGPNEKIIVSLLVSEDVLASIQAALEFMAGRIKTA